jgi:hypothetical protein
MEGGLLAKKLSIRAIDYRKSQCLFCRFPVLALLLRVQME